MSEPEQSFSKQPPQSQSRGRVRSFFTLENILFAGASQAVSAVLGGLLVLGATDAKPLIEHGLPGLHFQFGQDPNTAKVRAELDAQMNDLAHARAQQYTDALARPNSSQQEITGQAVNGKVIVKCIGGRAVAGLYHCEYAEPFVLTLKDPSAKPDKDGKFLAGAYLGVQHLSDVDGKTVEIQVIKFDPKTSKFTPNDLATVVLPEATYHVAPEGEFAIPQLGGVDPAGTYISPGNLGAIG